MHRLKKYNAGRIVHYNYCKLANHKRPTCPKRLADEVTAKEGVEGEGNESALRVLIKLVLKVVIKLVLKVVM